ncbi:hypothetical protein GCM10027280_59660 [Micromonospora polyrhachis]
MMPFSLASIAVAPAGSSGERPGWPSGLVPTLDAAAVGRVAASSPESPPPHAASTNIIDTDVGITAYRRM